MFNVLQKYDINCEEVYSPLKQKTYKNTIQKKQRMGRQCNTIQYNTEWKEIHVLCDSNTGTIKLIVTKLGRKNYRLMMTLMMTMMMMMMMIVSVANSSTQL